MFKLYVYGEAYLGVGKSIAVKILGLEKLCPEVSLGHFCRADFQEFGFDFRIRPKDNFDHFRRQIVLDRVGTITLRLHLGQKISSHTHVFKRWLSYSL